MEKLSDQRIAQLKAIKNRKEEIEKALRKKQREMAELSGGMSQATRDQLSSSSAVTMVNRSKVPMKMTMVDELAAMDISIRRLNEAFGKCEAELAKWEEWAKG